jgi:hypothetical protein
VILRNLYNTLHIHKVGSRMGEEAEEEIRKEQWDRDIGLRVSLKIKAKAK